MNKNSLKNFSQNSSPHDALDEPLILPITPGETLVRLSQVRGALGIQSAHAAPLQAAQSALLQAIENGARAQIAAQFGAAQKTLLAVYDAVLNKDGALGVLDVPSPTQVADPYFIAAPDAHSVVTTFTLRGKQVLTSIAFDRAPGASGYWLHVVRYWEENGETQRIEDPILESYAPLFPRVRLPVGTQILRLKARNASVSALSPEFQIEVPAL